jgi:RNA polymerase sigma factor (sigma-70 family)
MANDDDDAPLLAEYIRDRSARAFRPLADRYVRLMYQAALRQVGDAHLAEDVTQAVFLVLARRAGTIRSARVLPAWLLKTTAFAARNARLSESRRHHRERAAAMNAMQHEESPALEPDVRPMLDSALLRLSERDRSLVALHFFQGQDLAQLAAGAGMTPDAVRKRISRGRPAAGDPLGQGIDAVERRVRGR